MKDGQYWERQEAGWYLLKAPSPHAADPLPLVRAAILRERDRKWHVYIDATKQPGDSQHTTLRQAMRATEKVLRKRDRP